MFEPTMPISMTTISAVSRASARPGLEPLFLGGATCLAAPQSFPTEPSLAPSFLGCGALGRDRLVAVGLGRVRLTVNGQVLAIVPDGDGSLFVLFVRLVLEVLVVVGGLVVFADPVLVGLV